MTPTLASAFSDFLNAIMGIGIQLVHSLGAVFQAIFALGMDLITSVITFAQSFIKLGLDVFQGVFGFVAANFFVLAVLGGCYYFYTTRQGPQKKKNITTGKK